MVHEFIKTPKFSKILELNETLNNFGVIGKGFIQNPMQTMAAMTGSNWDYCVCEAFKLTNEIGVQVKCYSLQIGDEFINFIVFKNELFWYWFESFDKENLGIHEFHSWIRMINFITHKYGVKYSNFKLGLREINPLDNRVFEWSDDNYRSYLQNYQILEITDTKIEEPTNYINENGVMRKFSDTNENGAEYEGIDSIETKLLANDDLPLHRRSFNFNKCMKNLKTKGKTFSQKDRWDMFIKNFASTENNNHNSQDMASSIQQKVQRLRTQYKITQSPELANQIQNMIESAHQQGYLSVYSDNTQQDQQNQNNQQSTDNNQQTNNNPPKPDAMNHQDHSNGNNNANNSQDKTTATDNTNPPPQLVDLDATQATQTDGSFQGQAGQQGGMIIPEAMKKNMSPTAQQQQQQNQQGQQQQPQQNRGGAVGRFIKNAAIGAAGRWVGRAVTGAFLGV